MFKDFSGSCFMVTSRNRIKSPRRNFFVTAREILPAAGLLWKTVGALLLTTLVLGISSTIWYGLQVQVALDQIGRDRAVNFDLRSEHKLLAVKRDLILTQEHMEKTALKVGLGLPAKNQVRYP
jgi:hypothetical protein